MEALVLESPMIPPIGHRFSHPLFLAAEDITNGAAFVGDANPLHNDPHNPHTKQMGGIIASGSHVTGLFTAMIPTEFCKFGPMIGTQMTLKFTRPIFCDQKYEMCWTIESQEWEAKLDGHLFRLVGEITTNESGQKLVVVKADADIIFYGKDNDI